MKERFRAVNKISKHKMSLLWDRALACFYKEHAVVKAVQDGFTDDNNQTLLKRFQYLESLIMNGHFKKMPRKMKKAFIRELSARYNLCLIVLQHWDDFKALK
jgi:hypothetical protein